MNAVDTALAELAEHPTNHICGFTLYNRGRGTSRNLTWKTLDGLTATGKVTTVTNRCGGSLNDIQEMWLLPKAPNA